MRPLHRSEHPVDRLSDCIHMVATLSDLFASASDLHLVDPDRLSSMLSVIAATMGAALDDLTQAKSV